MLCTPHFKSTEGQTAHQEYVLQCLSLYEAHLMPVSEKGHLSNNLSRYRAMSQSDPCHKAYKLFSESIFEQISIFFFANDRLFFTELLFIEKDCSFIGIKVDDDSRPLIGFDGLLLNYFETEGLVLDCDGCAELDDYDLATGP